MARDSGDVVELSREVFRKTDAPAPTYPDLLAVGHRAPLRRLPAGAGLPGTAALIPVLNP